MLVDRDATAPSAKPADHLHHRLRYASRLAVQVGPTQMLEYAFGDWRYYVEGEKGVWRGAVALLTPTQAGFGRRSLSFVPDSDRFTELAGADRSAAMQIDQADVERLVSELEARYQKNITTEVQAEWSDFTFVRDDLPYHLFHNSNHQTAGSVRRLGAEVRGSPILSNFRLQMPRPDRD